MSLTYVDHFTKFTDSNGNVIAFGTAKFGADGVDPETTPQSPYADLDLSIFSGTSIPLNADGSLKYPFYLSGAQSVSIYDEDGTEILSSLSMTQAPPSSLPDGLVFRDDVTGEALSGGKLFFGDIFQDPLKHPKNVYSDSGHATSLGSIVTLSSTGTTGQTIYLDGEYSVKLVDSDNVQVGYTGKYLVTSAAAALCSAATNWNLTSVPTYTESSGAYVTTGFGDINTEFEFTPKGGYATGLRKEFLLVKASVTNAAAQLAGAGVSATSSVFIQEYVVRDTTSSRINDINLYASGNNKSTPSGEYIVLVYLANDYNGNDVGFVDYQADFYNYPDVIVESFCDIDLVDLADMTKTDINTETHWQEVPGGVDLDTLTYNLGVGNNERMTWNASESRWEGVIATDQDDFFWLAVNGSWISNGALLLKIGVVSSTLTNDFVSKRIYLFNSAGDDRARDLIFTDFSEAPFIVLPGTTNTETQQDEYTSIPLDDSSSNVAYLAFEDFFSGSLSPGDKIYIEEFYFVPA